MAFEEFVLLCHSTLEPYSYIYVVSYICTQGVKYVGRERIRNLEMCHNYTINQEDYVWLMISVTEVWHFQSEKCKVSQFWGHEVKEWNVNLINLWYSQARVVPKDV